MKKIFPQTDEFYIGYVSSAPERIGSFFKNAIRSAAVIISIIAVVLAISQRDFSASEFEYGVSTTLSGILVKSPVPHIRIPLGKNQSGKELFQTVLLVGSGKHGLDQELKNFPSSTLITLKGYLIYGDGKALLQVNDINEISLSGKPNFVFEDCNATSPEHISLTGEITDPKCYFGVMKPGEGKPHRSCAIRCIAGGIPSVFKTNSADYFLLVNENMQPLNSEILSIVGDEVSLDGETVELDDWKILKVETNRIRALAKSTLQQKKLLAMEADITICSH